MGRFAESILNGPNDSPRRAYVMRRRYRISTSRFGVGQKSGSNRTPLGLHRVAEKIGEGRPIGTAFRSRKPVGLVWHGLPREPIVHRILWLEGLERGFNRGGTVDSHARYIYLHGTHDEMTLGRPASRGCIHVAAADLLPLFDKLPVGTLVWITDQTAGVRLSDISRANPTALVGQFIQTRIE